MGSPTPQDHRLAAAAHPSTTYISLEETALAFINAQKHNPSLPTKLDFPALAALTTPSYSHTFGPRFAVSHAPKLQGAFDFARFRAHLEGMLPLLERWEIDVEDVAVDGAGKSVVLRTRYEMWVKGAGEGVENEVVWWLELEEGVSGSETGEGKEEGGWKIRKSTEFVDFAASARIRELMVGGADGGRGKETAAGPE